MTQEQVESAAGSPARHAARPPANSGTGRQRAPEGPRSFVEGSRMRPLCSNLPATGSRPPGLTLFHAGGCARNVRGRRRSLPSLPHLQLALHDHGRPGFPCPVLPALPSHCDRGRLLVSTTPPSLRPCPCVAGPPAWATPLRRPRRPSRPLRWRGGPMCAIGIICAGVS